jgi:nitroreductase
MQDMSTSVRTDVMRVLLTRSSVAPKTLGAPGPSPEEILVMIAAGLTAPDHDALRPSRFIVIEGEGRAQLSEVFVEIRKRTNARAGKRELARTWRRMMRAPTLVGVAASLHKDHPKVPMHEQYISVGAALQGVMLAAHALGYGAILLGGNRSRDPLVRDLLDLAHNEEMIGFISIGTPSKQIHPKPRPLPDTHLTIWRGNAIEAPTAYRRCSWSGVETGARGGPTWPR